MRSFYATQALPSTGTIVGSRLLVRGPLFILLCLLLTRMLGMPRLSGALAVGVLFTVRSGVASLLVGENFIIWRDGCLAMGRPSPRLWPTPSKVRGRPPMSEPGRGLRRGRKGWG